MDNVRSFLQDGSIHFKMLSCQHREGWTMVESEERSVVKAT